MNATLRSLTAAAAMLTVSSFGALAAVATVADLGLNPNFTLPSPVNSTGAISEDYLFQISAPASFSAIVSNTFFGDPASEIVGLSLAIFSCTSCIVGPGSTGNPVAGLTLTTSTAPDIFHIASLSGLLQAGSYFLRVTGTGGSGAAYGGNVSTAAAAPGPTPIPSTLPLFATGIGAMGLLAWRRKRRVAAAV